MTRTSPIAVFALAALVVAAPMAAAAPSGGPATLFDQETGTTTATPADNASVTPGEMLSGVVGVGEAEFEGEVAERTFGLKVAKASTDAAKADVVAEQFGDVERRVDELEQRKATLEEARANGSMGEGEFRARMATVAAELSTARRLANASAATAQGLPDGVLAAKGIDAAAIRTLANRAGELSGPEVAEIAQSIAGSEVGRSMAGAQTPPGVAEGAPNGTDVDVPNGTDVDAPNGTDVDAPNGTDADTPGDTDDVQTPNGTDDGAPNGTDAGADQ